MIKESDGKIGAREIIILIFLIVMMKMIANAPVVFFNEVKNAGWMLPVFSLFIILLPLGALLSLMHRHKDKGLIEVIYILLGKYLGFGVSLFIFLLSFAIMIFNARAYIKVAHIMFLPTTPDIALLVFLFAASYFVANRGLETIARTATFFFPLAFVAGVILFVIAREFMNIEFLFPVFGAGIKTIFTSSARYSSILGEVFLLTAFSPFMRAGKGFRHSYFFGLLSSTLYLTFVYIMYITVFNYPQIETLDLPFYQFIDLIHSESRTIDVQGFYLGAWAVITTLYTAIFLYLTTAILAYSLRLREFEPLLLPISGLSVMLGIALSRLLPETFIRAHAVLFQVNSLIFFLLPISLWVIARFKGMKLK